MNQYIIRFGWPRILVDLLQLFMEDYFWRKSSYFCLYNRVRNGLRHLRNGFLLNSIFSIYLLSLVQAYTHENRIIPIFASIVLQSEPIALSEISANSKIKKLWSKWWIDIIILDLPTSKITSLSNTGKEQYEEWLNERKDSGIIKLIPNFL